MKLYKTLGLIITFILVLYSCSTKKNTFVSRNFHALTAKNNVLFNGKQAFEKGLKTISEKHEDNFWKRLQLEPITFDERTITGPKFNNLGAGFDASEPKESSSKTATSFDRAEEKAVKAIQKHSINIEGYEKNSQIDDAYLLLGKARYFTQRFIPAIESYNYIIANYPKANLNYETRVWRAKANIRLGNEEMAIETMNLLLKILDDKEEVSKRVQEEAYTAMAMAYAETDTIQKVIENLTKATETFINKEQSARNMFVLGQIYGELNYKDSARMVFKKLADNRRAPEKYRIHANIELVKNSAKDSSSVLLIKRFKKLIRNTDNRTYLDELYYQTGVLEENRDSIDNAISYYKKSAASKNAKDYQKTYTFERLGTINFNKQKYLLASAYYDSVLQISSKKFDDEKRIRRIRRKNKGLIKLKKHEDLVKNNDSILRFVSMTEEERVVYFENYIIELKKVDEERKQQLLNAQSFGSSINNGNSFINNNNAGKWYFYNSQSKNFGQSEFKRIWGNRSLEDNWRFSNKNIINSEKEKEEEEVTTDTRYELITYLNKIPSDQEEISLLKEKRNNALYQLGLIYKEQFKNNDLAIKNLERLNKINQQENLKLPISYHLYQLYSRTENETVANKFKQYILNNHADSNFAEIIRNPGNNNTVKNVKEDEILKKYKEIYYLYKYSHYEEVVSEIKSFQQNVDNSEIIPKLALLKALAIGQYQSKEAYKKELEYVAFSYPDKEEGKKAKEIIKLIK